MHTKINVRATMLLLLIFIIVVSLLCTRWHIHAHSPTDTSRTYTLGEETNEATVINSQYDKVVYAAPAQTVTVPHQASATGDMYAVSTKAVNRKNKEQPPQEDVDIGQSKRVEAVSANTS